MRELAVFVVVSAVLSYTHAQDFEHEAIGKKSTSLPRLSNCVYKEKGEVKKLDSGLEVYVVGNGTKCIVWNYDIFGFNAGRTRELCDYFADQGYLVVMPDYYRGQLKIPGTPGTVEFLKNQTEWDNLKSDWEEVKQFAVSEGAQTFGTIGTCWGSYPVVRLSTLPDFKAGVSMHPSHSPIMNILQEDEEEVYKQIKCPQLLMPSQSDSANVKPGGLAEKVLKDNVTIIEFNEMQHGWTTRGNLSIPAIDRDVHKAIGSALDFFKNNLD